MSTTQRRALHVNSSAAYWQGKTDLFSKRELDVLAAYRVQPGGKATDRQIMVALGFTDMNSVRPRITDLVKDGVLAEVGAEQDPQTGKRVRVVQIVYRNGQAELPLVERSA